MIFIMKFQAAAMGRAKLESKDRRDFCLYVDEFQNFQTDSFESILSEARKYGLNLIMANQFITQLTDEIREAIFGNIGTVVAHRVGTADAEQLEKLFRPVFDVDDLQRLPTFNAIVRTLIRGVPTQPFSMVDLPIEIVLRGSKKLADALKQLSAAKYGRPKSVVEAEIFKRLTTEEPVASKPDLAAFGDSRLAQPGATVKAGGQSQSSFLDDWLAKRRTVSGKPADQKLAPPADKTRATQDSATPSETSPNISSSSIDSSEIDSIAKQIKQDFSSVEKQKNQSLNVDSISPKTDTHGILEHDDVIHIDKDGNISYDT
jgi:hypothetical protein